jgi:hypothetical protein
MRVSSHGPWTLSLSLSPLHVKNRLSTAGCDTMIKFSPCRDSCSSFAEQGTKGKRWDHARPPSLPFHASMTHQVSARSMHAWWTRQGDFNPSANFPDGRTLGHASHRAACNSKALSLTQLELKRIQCDCDTSKHKRKIEEQICRPPHALLVLDVCDLRRSALADDTDEHLGQLRHTGQNGRIGLQPRIGVLVQ